MIVNKERAEKVLEMALREFKDAVRSFEGKDYVDTLKHLQESSEYLVKAILATYGIDYPKVHKVGFCLLQIKEKLPNWFVKKCEELVDIADELADDRPKFRYPYEYPPEDYKIRAKVAFQRVEKACKNCEELIRKLFKV
jgi:HEPN domain-containing protein